MKPTPELKLAKSNWSNSAKSIKEEIYLSDCDNPKELEKQIIIAERFITATRNLITELTQKHGIAHHD